MNRRSFLSRLVGAVVATAAAIRLERPKPLPLDKIMQTGNRFGKSEMSAYYDEWYVNQQRHSVNQRRHIVYQYPNDSYPLVGLLSLMDSDESQPPNWWK